ncbi:Hypothetical protein, putative [Bodo saltans]|uniref:Uncharacterized protein n=1 Tax=Bodo saltans TaxID=75058 RepID=A0A0S4KKH3_BODSA|nr:Hypothetical protein, putative [Bodo saltans]|eukprot:CUI14961.1 Hypothetical protein, putative [Bodo saltans]
MSPFPSLLFVVQGRMGSSCSCSQHPTTAVDVVHTKTNASSPLVAGSSRIAHIFATATVGITSSKPAGWAPVSPTASMCLVELHHDDDDADEIPFVNTEDIDTPHRSTLSLGTPHAAPPPSSTGNGKRKFVAPASANMPMPTGNAFRSVLRPPQPQQPSASPREQRPRRQSLDTASSPRQLPSPFSKSANSDVAASPRSQRRRSSVVIEELQVGVADHSYRDAEDSISGTTTLASPGGDRFEDMPLTYAGGNPLEASSGPAPTHGY